ncbi:hypothetical protein [Streptococcus oralis]|uniref:Phage protein n=1 Tax=Streptococcus oralis TaxID=1303 RepID=A0AAW7W6Q4_STROR|nr:hypothetical protein [Streptococcus oralis]MDO6343341.1 hypothetical protein [Streptococcus oralis]MDO6347319.1 hypothetical protein [Streptococcus oralis]MDO6349277.1 hypothetical protein [Streptococcus oralis]
MGFLKKLFGNVEKANKGEIPAEEIVPPFTIDLVEEADDYWRQMEQNLLINAVKAAGGPEAVERAFVLANFKENQETFELFYQVNGQLLSWKEMDESIVAKISNQLLPQAPEVARAVNENYEEAKVPVIEYAMLQFETATMAWFGRKLTTASPEAQLTFEELVSGWRAILEQEVPNRPLDSDRPFPYFEV